MQWHPPVLCTSGQKPGSGCFFQRGRRGAAVGHGDQLPRFRAFLPVLEAADLETDLVSVFWLPLKQPGQEEQRPRTAIGRVALVDICTVF